MKYFAGITVLFILVVFSQQEPSPEAKQKLRQTLGKCIKETKVEPELLKKEHNGGDVDDKNVKCFYKCMMVSMGTMDSNGQVHLEMMANKIPAGERRDKFKTFVDKCRNEKGADPCETAFALHKCGKELKRRKLI